MIKGIDLFHGNGAVDFSKVKADGVEFVFLKASQGVDYQDPAFGQHIASARAVGLVTGAYHFFDPTHDPLDQAVNFLSCLKPEHFPLLIALDAEQHDGWDTLSPEQISQDIQAFLDHVSEQVRGPLFVYTDIAFIKQYLTVFPMGAYKLWLAHSIDGIPDGFNNWVILQSGNGPMAGISCNVDLDVFEGAVADLEALTVSKRV